MTENRMRQLVRDPTFESPTFDYFEVRMPWVSFAVPREAAERIVEALTGLHRAEWVRAETVTGSVVWVRTEAVVFVREWTRAQRATEDAFWKAVDAEAQEQEEAPPEQDGVVEPSTSVTTSSEDVAGQDGTGTGESGGFAQVLGAVMVTIAIMQLIRFLML